jgi:hypothetical protein
MAKENQMFAFINDNEEKFAVLAVFTVIVLGVAAVLSVYWSTVTALFAQVCG